jgi:hypothetical protein
MLKTAHFTADAILIVEIIEEKGTLSVMQWE